MLPTVPLWLAAVVIDFYNIFFGFSTQVTISTGVIEGRILMNQLNNRKYYAFQGIPFAKPPIGTLRFQAPVKPDPWTGVKATKADPQPCINDKEGSEDCLYLNVYVNKINRRINRNKMPVLVWFYGGRFKWGKNTKDPHGPEYLLKEDVVIVIPNYRVYAFGFLSTQDEAAEGNAGLKDQAAALHWVRDNIQNFGGDPNKVTIFGGSAGSVSVHHHTLSHLSRGLFHRAIMQSGSALNEWAFQPNPTVVAFKLGQALGIYTNDTKTLVKRLQETSADDIVNVTYFSTVMGITDDKSVLYFAPSKERVHSGAFISESPYQILKDGKAAKVPYIIGYNQDEGHFKRGSQVTATFVSAEQRKKSEEEHEYYVPVTLNLEKGSSVSEQAAEDVYSYFSNEFSQNNTMTDLGFLQFVSQYMFTKGIRKTVEMLKNNRDVYFYRFDYEGEGHGSEQKFLFHYTNFDTKQMDVSNKLVRLWTNFAKTGNPTPVEDPLLNNIKWEKASSTSDKSITYLDIKDGILKSGTDVDQKSFNFWLKLYDTYGKPAFYAW